MSSDDFCNHLTLLHLLLWLDWDGLIMSANLKGNSLPFNTTELLEKAQQYEDEANLSARGSSVSLTPAKVPFVHGVLCATLGLQRL